MRTLFESFESVDAFDLNELIEETRSSGEIAEGTTGVDPPTQASDYRQWWHARFDAVVGGGEETGGGRGERRGRDEGQGRFKFDRFARVGIRGQEGRRGGIGGEEWCIGGGWERGRGGGERVERRVRNTLPMAVTPTRNTQMNSPNLSAYIYGLFVSRLVVCTTTHNERLRSFLLLRSLLHSSTYKCAHTCTVTLYTPVSTPSWLTSLLMLI